MLFVLIAAGALGVIAGVLAYTGRWRRWAERSMYLHCAGFALLFVGSGVLLLGVAAAFPRELGLVDALFVLWGPLLVGGVLSYLWLPAWLLPRWFREGRDERRALEREMRAARKSAR